MARASNTPAPTHTYEPMYGWALQASGRPVPISLANRGANNYICPICNGPMVAKKGDINQHHFSHESITKCTPAEVADAIGKKWLVLALGTAMILGQTVPIRWVVDGQKNEANLLKGVTSIVENLPTRYGVAEIALLTDTDIRAVLVLSLEDAMSNEALAQFAASGITIIILPSARFRSGDVDIATLFDQAEVHGGWWLHGKPDDLPELELDPEKIRKALGEAVVYPPYRFWSPLADMGMQMNVLKINIHLLWLPENMWMLAVGGTHHRLSDKLEIITQEWPQQDRSTIALYYIKLRKDRAVAIRRFLPDEHVHASLNASFRMLRATAEQIAYHLATS